MVVGVVVGVGVVVVVDRNILLLCDNWMDEDDMNDFLFHPRIVFVVMWTHHWNNILLDGEMVFVWVVVDTL